MTRPRAGDVLVFVIALTLRLSYLFAFDDPMLSTE